MSNYIEIGPKLKAWVKGVDFADNTQSQAVTTASLSVVENVALMPDCHLGKGSTVGSVIATSKAIIPASVGVDIGCGMCAVRTSLTANDLPDTLSFLRSEIEHAIPHGRTNNGGNGDKGSWNGRSGVPASVSAAFRDNLQSRFDVIVDKHPKIGTHNTVTQLSSMGTGNHFFELCLDEDDRVWVMLHSGSRGVGNRIGTYFITKAKEEMARRHIGVPDVDLSYLEEGTEVFDDYIEAMLWAQDFAALNRKLMLDRGMGVLRKYLPSFTMEKKAINCHHNYANRETHFGKDVWVTRKGAVNASKGQLGIIPGSMGTGSFIVEGLGNPDSMCSCSHGAGRVMSRTQAKKLITLEDHIKATEGIECRKDIDVVDESPAAYKPIEGVMAAQDDLIIIKHRLRQVLNIKG